MPRTPIALLALALALTSNSAFAFGAVGHMAVGAIADKLITGTNAAKRARAILGTNLKTAAVWADCAKGVGTASFKYSGEGHYPECAIYENPASERQMEAYVRRNVGNCPPAFSKEVCHKQYHYTDVATQRAAYVKGQVGTSGQDIVAAISAAITVLQDKPSPDPFKISSKKEALRLLTHFIGDVHQPLHVVAVYLDASGNVIDPDQSVFNPQTETTGGNDLFAGSSKLHGLWDTVTGAVSADTPSDGTIGAANAVPATAGPLSDWSAAWATETLTVGKVAFVGLTYSSEDSKNHYQVTLPPGYSGVRAKLQSDQVVKAGARLAQILKAIWPD